MTNVIKTKMIAQTKATIDLYKTMIEEQCVILDKLNNNINPYKKRLIGHWEDEEDADAEDYRQERNNEYFYTHLK